MEKSVQKSVMIYESKKAALENSLWGYFLGSNMHAMKRVCVYECDEEWKRIKFAFFSSL